MLNIQKSYTGTNQISLSDVKNYLKIDYTTDDTLLTNLITEAREVLEDFTNIGFIEATITGITESTYFIKLPYGPINNIHYIKTYETGTDISYTYDGFYLKPDYLTNEKLKIVYDAGYDSDLENKYKRVWFESISYLYENRGDEPLMNWLYYNVPVNLLSENTLWL